MTSKKEEAIQWDRVLVDLIVPYEIRRDGHDELFILKIQLLRTTGETNYWVTRSKR